jgi:hypothetical protein
MRILLYVVSSALFVAAIVGSVAFASIQTEPTRLTRVLHARRPLDERLDDAPPAIGEVELAGYLYGIIRTWSGPAKPVEQIDLHELAADIARVAYLNPPAWPTDTNRHRTVLLLATLAYFEGARFASYVDSGDCNEWMHEAWKHSWRRGGRFIPGINALPRAEQRLLAFGNCDGGRAHSLFQIHPEDAHVSAEELRDRVRAATVALDIARRSLAMNGTLSGYSGEGFASAPKAAERLRFAAREYAKRP